MKTKNKIIRYASGIDQEKSDDTVKIPEWKSKKVGVSSAKVYIDALPVLLNISPFERLVLDYCVIVMNEDNYVRNDADFKTGLNDLFERDEEVINEFSSGVVNKAFSKLNELDILIKKPSWKRGLYQVNPLYFFKGSNSARERWVRRILEAPFYEENRYFGRKFLY